MLSTLLYGALRAAGITALARSAGNGGSILCYHNIVRKGKIAGAPGLHLPIDEFAHQMRWLSRNYSIVSLREFADRLESGGMMRRIAAITFDDGYAGVFDLAWPLLRDAGVPATVFVPTDVAGVARGYWWDHPEIVRRTTPPRRSAWLTALMGDAQLIEDAEMNGPSTPIPPSLRAGSWEKIAAAAAEGFDIGVHSASHRNLIRLSAKELADETAGSRRALFARTGVLADGFAYPYGMFDARVRDAVRRAGYRIAVTLEFGLNRAPADPLALSRINVPASIRPPAFEAWAAGLRLRSST